MFPIIGRYKTRNKANILVKFDNNKFSADNCFAPNLCITDSAGRTLKTVFYILSATMYLVIFPIIGDEITNFCPRHVGGVFVDVYF